MIDRRYIDRRYDVYLDEEKISSDMHIEDAMIFIKAVYEDYASQLAKFGSKVSIKLTDETINMLKEENN